MSQRIIVIVALVLFGTCFACSPRHDQKTSGTDSAAVAATGYYYTCPMHPFVRSDHPGACPVCGMALVKRTVGEAAAASEPGAINEVSLSPTQMVLANVETDTVRERTLNKEITSVGVVSVAEPLEATIAARFRGRVGKLYADYTGVLVRKGQPLFELYSPDIISAAQDYILALDAARSSAPPSDPREGSAQDKLVMASRTRLQNHFGMTDEQVSRLGKTRETPTTVRFDSPIMGTVLSKNVQEGQYVDEGTVLYELADLSKVWMYLDVYEQNIRFVSVGQDVTITTDAYPGEEFHGRVTFIDPTMNSETRTIKVRTEFPNPDLKLKPNMFVTAHIQIPIKNALVVPNSAILQTGKRNVVWVEMRPNAFQPRDVVIGSSTDNASEILSGLHRGDIVAVSGGFLIDSESQLSGTSGTVMPQHPGMKMDNAPSGNNASSPSSDAGTGTMQMDQMKSSSDPVAHPSSMQRKSGKPSSTQDVAILVHGSYLPDKIRAKVGQNIRLHFFRDEDSECTSEVVFEDFGIRRLLPPRDTVLIEITPRKAGTIDFHCGMGMVHGTIIVSK